MKSAQARKLYDVVIVGAGVPGSSVAAALAHSALFNPKKILVIDAAPKLPNIQDYFQEERIPEPRVVTLTPSSLHLIRSLGLFSQNLINQKYLSPFFAMQIYDTQSTQHIRLSNQQYGSCIFSQLQLQLEKQILSTKGSDALLEMRQNMGATIENSHLQAALLEKAKRAQIEVRTGVSLEMQYNSPEKQGYVQLNLTDGKGEVQQSLETRVLVAGDGANSSVRKQIKMPTWGISYGQTGLVCTLEMDQPFDTAYQRFINGPNPLALLPLWGNYASIVWSNHPSRNAELVKLSEQAFLDELNSSLRDPPKYQENCGFSRILGNSSTFEHPPLARKLATKRFQFPLQQNHAINYRKGRIAFVGDAAHSIHPLAGQGMNLGITDAALLVNAILRAKKLGQEIGQNPIMQEYEDAALKNAYSMSIVIDALFADYKKQHLVSRKIRSLGYSIMEASALIKQNVMNFASGTFTHPLEYEWES